MKNTVTVLIVDDNLLFRETLREILRLTHPGWQVLEASNGRIGLDLAQARQPDLILLDFNMPIMNGYEVASALRERPETANIPIALISSEDQDNPIMVRMRSLCQEILSKPFSLRDIDRLIERILTRTPTPHVRRSVTRHAVLEAA
jgi:CheY-like chemotaxis protein